MLFGRSKPKGSTLLLLDIENGSVASALVRVSEREQPKLFGEWRIWLSPAVNLSGAELAANVERALEEALRHAAQVAARLRAHEATASQGAVSGAAVFLSPPWGTPDLAVGKPRFVESMAKAAHRAIDALFGIRPSLYAAASAAAFGARAALGAEPSLVVSVTGEVSELVLLSRDGVIGHATIPSGAHTALRTLRTHGGLSEHEARSALKLSFDTPRLREPFASVASHFSGHFGSAAGELFAAAAPVSQVRVLAQGGAGEWFAEALAQSDRLAELFPQGGEVRALKAQYLLPYVAAHAALPDIALLLQAIFVDCQ